MEVIDVYGLDPKEHSLATPTLACGAKFRSISCSFNEKALKKYFVIFEFLKFDLKLT
jgi:hypothetical protein